LDLMPEKLLEEKVDVEQLRNALFWKEFYEQTRAQVRRVTELLKDLLIATEKSDSPVLAEVRLDQAVARSLQRFGGILLQHKITVFNQVPPDLPALVVEEQKFQHLLDLLLKDEIARLPAISQVFVSARLHSGKTQKVEIQVKDDGPRWSKEALRSVFDPFSLRIINLQEFAINLIACYFIVHHYGGTIDVRNREPRGVVFTVTFPIRPKMFSPAEGEEDFITTVMMNDVFWEKILAGQD
jgi:two-component system probable response regulator PhcQ